MNSHRYPLILSVFRVTSPSDRGYLRLNNQEDNGLITKPVPVREAVWYGEPAPGVASSLMAVS